MGYHKVMELQEMNMKYCLGAWVKAQKQIKKQEIALEASVNGKIFT